VKSWVRWLIAGLVVATAAVIALWPRSASTPVAAPAPDLGPARAKAALTRCASGSGPAELAGVRAQCLADGATVDLAAAVGRPALVNVWATWCVPCRDELPVLAEYAATPGAVPVVGVAVQSDPAGALDLLSSLHVRFANLLDSDGAATRALKLTDALPASYLVTPDGSVRLITDPRPFHSVDQVRQTVGGR
jgi:thiol-disulfide isomerase/thioredoxin